MSDILQSAPRSVRVVALCGGVGGAKLALGLEHIVGGDLSLIVNTGDDFEHMGLAVSPDIDTVLYTLAGLSDRERGWGRSGETWTFMAALGELGGETWFNLGDKDLALHVLRTARLAAGETLTDIVSGIASGLGISAAVLPMSNDPLRTFVDTDEGTLPFQHYFVKRRCEPVVKGIRFEARTRVEPTREVVGALSDPDLTAIIVCPSNPYLSIDPIIAIHGLRDLIRKSRVPVIVVSPVVRGSAIKGPTAKIMTELGRPITPAAIAAHYRDLLTGLVVERGDDLEGIPASVAVLETSIVMKNDGDKIRLAEEVLDFAASLRRSGGEP